MKVKAKTNIKYNNQWYAVGDMFEVRDYELAGLKDIVDTVSENTESRIENVQNVDVSIAEPETVKKPVRRPRKKIE